MGATMFRQGELVGGIVEAGIGGFGAQNLELEAFGPIDLAPATFAESGGELEVGLG
jgi:hypothetical protein